MPYKEHGRRQAYYADNPLVDPASVEYDASDEHVLDIDGYVRIIRRRRSLIAVVLAVVLVAAAIGTLAQKPRYAASSTVVVQSAKPNVLGGLAAGVSFFPEIQSLMGSSSLETVIALMLEDHFLDKVFKSFDAKTRKRAFGSDEKLPNWALDIKNTRNTDLVQVCAISYSPRISAELVDRIIKEYIRQDEARNKNLVDETRGYAQEKMELLGRQLQEANRSLAEFKSKNGLFAPEVQVSKMAEYFAILEVDRNNAKADLAGVRNGLKVVERQLAGQQAMVVSSNAIKESPRFADAMKSIDDLQRKRVELLQEYKPEAAEVKAIDGQIVELRARLKGLAQTIVDSKVVSRNPVRDSLISAYSDNLAKEASNEARIGAVNAELERGKRDSASLPEKERLLTQLMQQVEVLERTYGAVSEKYYTLILSEKAQSNNLMPIANAEVNPIPVSPKIVKNMATAFVFGLIAALLGALGAERLDTRIKDRKSVEDVTGHIISAVIPEIEANIAPLIDGAQTPLPLLESFRVLRNSIYLAGIESELRTIAVTSANPGEGKSVTCINLGRMMALDGRKVIIVDCNEYRPSIGRMLKASYEAGLTNVLTGVCTLDQAIAPANPSNLNVLTTGPLVFNFPELLVSAKGREVFEQLAERFDTVLIDCPVVSCFSDLQAVSMLADAFLMVVALTKTKEAELATAVQNLNKLQAPILGLVVRGEGVSVNAYQNNGSVPLVLPTERDKVKR